MSTHALSLDSTVRVEAVGRRRSGLTGVVKFAGDSWARVRFEDGEDEWFAVADLQPTHRGGAATDRKRGSNG